MACVLAYRLVCLTCCVLGRRVLNCVALFVVVFCWWVV